MNVDAASLANEVAAIAKKVTNLPTLPTVYTTLCEVMNNPHSTIADVVETISGDKATVSRVLRLVNSAAYGLNKRVDTVSQAVVLIGVQEVRNLVLGSSVMTVFEDSDGLQGMTPELFWEHCIGVGLATRLLGRAAGMVDVESLYVAGLLHDIGKLFFMSNMREDYARVLKLANREKLSVATAEKRILGVDHTEAGAQLAEHWRLPEYLRQVIRSHHRLPATSANKTIIAIVHVADYWVRALAMGNPGDNLVKHPREEAWKIITLRNDTFEKMTPLLVREHRQVVNQLMMAQAD